MKKEIIPAIIAKNQEEFEKRILKVCDFFDVIQLDFMDGVFVPNNSIDFDFKIPKCDCKFEAHLMVNDPYRWVVDNFEKVDTVLVHYESTDDHEGIIDLVKNKGKRIGFVLNPETHISSIQEYLRCLDQVLIMTVNPGFYGSPFLTEMVDKIKRLRRMKPDIDIEVDGGINDKTIGLVNDAGANLFVSGSYIVKSDDIKRSIDSLNTIIK